MVSPPGLWRRTWCTPSRRQYWHMTAMTHRPVIDVYGIKMIAMATSRYSLSESHIILLKLTLHSVLVFLVQSWCNIIDVFRKFSFFFTFGQTLKYRRKWPFIMWPCNQRYISIIKIWYQKGSDHLKLERWKSCLFLELGNRHEWHPLSNYNGRYINSVDNWYESKVKWRNSGKKSHYFVEICVVFVELTL